MSDLCDRFWANDRTPSSRRTTAEVPPYWPPLLLDGHKASRKVVCLTSGELEQHGSSLTM